MDNQRLLIWSLFGVMLFLTWQAWIEDYATPARPAETPAAQEPADNTAAPDRLAPPAARSTDAVAPPVARSAPDLPAVGAAEDAGSIEVRTDVLDIRISRRGGRLVYAELLNYPVAKDDPDNHVILFDSAPANYGELRAGILVDGEAAAPLDDAVFTAAEPRYELGSGDALDVVLSWQNESGLTAEKVYRFRRGSYIIDVEQRLTNGSDAAVTADPYFRLVRRSREPERSMFDVDSYSFDGPIVYTGEKSEKLDRDDLLESDYDFSSTNGWLAMIQHHFLVALAPTDDAQRDYTVVVDDDLAIATAQLDAPRRIEAGATETFAMTAFVGPKLQAQLEEIAETLKLTVDYGWLTIISDPLFWLLSFVHQFVQNWGLAIILVTVLIKLAFYKLTEASGRSMAKMREIQPRMKAIQERYKDDRQAQSQAMMDLYKREKVNPAAGCLPILIQMPFFLAFYWVLLESVEMRQAPFAGWISDLSSRDPYFILPLIMGAAMLFQQKLNPAPADPVQARVMQVMPVIFTGFFAFFPAGLVLYWVTNTLLSIAQQWHINRVVGEENRRRKKGNRSKSKTDKK